MQISDNGIRFIETNEGFSATVYGDVGHSAIGYGHDLLPGESFPMGVTEAQAEALLTEDVGKVEAALNPLIPATCTQNQFDALCDFGYNLGCGALKTMLAHGWDQVPEQMLRWDFVDGQPNAGVEARRAAEAQLFNT